MNEFNLLYPQGTAPGFQKISETACNDLSLEYILSHVAKNEYEKNLIKRMMTGLESAVIFLMTLSIFRLSRIKSETRSTGLIISKHLDGALTTTLSRRFGN